MKKLNRLPAFIILFTVFFFASCSKDDASDESNTVVIPTNSGTFKSDFDGNTFVANTVNAIVNSDYIAINGMKSTGEFFQITIPNAKVGTYNLKTNPTNFGLIYSAGSGKVPFMAVSDSEGTFASYSEYTDVSEVKITAIDVVNKKISGTFKFNGIKFKETGSGVEIKSFSNGSFTDVSYTGDVVVETPSKNTFFAKIDNVDFKPAYIDAVNAGGFISIVGRRGTVENITIAVSPSVTAGTSINFSAFDSTRGQYISDGSPNGIFGGEGILKITFHDLATKRIKGTFSFNAENYATPKTFKKITEGSFDVTY